jgi:hypothetical protein
MDGKVLAIQKKRVQRVNPFIFLQKKLLIPLICLKHLDLFK